MSEITSPWGILNGIRPVKIAYKLIKSGMTSQETVEYFINLFQIFVKSAESFI